MAEGGSPAEPVRDPGGSTELYCCPEWKGWEQNLEEHRDEVMALESTYGEDGPVRVVSKPTDQDKGIFSLEIEVEVQLPDDGITVEIWVPYAQNTTLPEGSVISKVPAHNRPNFMRSESGRQWHSAFLVKHLSPLSLFVTLPPTYPSDTAPLFTLSCVWLDAGQLSDLCQQLDQLWTEACGMPVIYTWIDWLQDSTLSSLHLERSVTLMPYLEGDELTLGVRDPRALPECSDAAEDIVQLIEYDNRKQWEEFVKAEHECGICFCEYPGDQFYLIDECQHHCCRDCMTNYCAMHVTDGTVQQLKCPLEDCKLSVPPVILRDVLGQEAYIRWERLCLQKALETMDDVTWCPRCNWPVIRDSDETQAYCTNCMYSFCPRCTEPYHAKSACKSVEEQIVEIAQKTRILAGGITDTDGSLARERLLKLKAEFLTKSYLKKEAKNCPKCKVPIEKNGGCNKVTCTQCGCSMCWLCGKRISGYDHFNTTGTACNLFQVQNERIDRWLQQLNNRPRPPGADAVQQAMMAGRPAVLAACPRCRQRNLRNGTNNHIKCWACKVNFCYQCRKGIEKNVSSHYTAAMPCNQHGDT